MDDRSELDEFAIRMETAVDRFIGNPNASRNFVQVKFATDATTGAYPQAKRDTTKVYWKDDSEEYLDRCPECVREPLLLKLARTGKWTDVLSSDLWSEGYLLSERALGVVRQFPLGNSKSYAAEVRRNKESRPYTYVFIANHVAIDDLDFHQSEFYVADMIGGPKQVIAVTSATDFVKKRQQIASGELEGCTRFNRLECKRIHFRTKRVPTAAIFGLGTLSTSMYIRRELFDALRDAGVTGFEYLRNNKLFDE